jgi:hypothetical protein
MAMCDNSSIFLLNRELVSYSSNSSVEWNAGNFAGDHPVAIPASSGKCGLTFVEDSTLSMIGGNGELQWKYQFDSPVKADFVGHNGSFIVMTNDYVISIHKPVLSTTMNYFVVLLAIDLFVKLMSVVRIVDMLWPKAKSRID